MYACIQPDSKRVAIHVHVLLHTSVISLTHTPYTWLIRDCHCVFVVVCIDIQITCPVCILRI